jgi:hypothetical protein
MGEICIRVNENGEAIGALVYVTLYDTEEVTGMSVGGGVDGVKGGLMLESCVIGKSICSCGRGLGGSGPTCCR